MTGIDSGNRVPEAVARGIRWFVSAGLLTGVGAAAALAGELHFQRTVIDPDFRGGYQVEVADVDGDGRPDLVALGGGTCAWYQNPTWTKRVITGPDRSPAIISSATADLDGDGRAEVAIAYDFEMNQPRRGKLGLAVAGDSLDAPWSFRPIADVPSIHRVRFGDLDGDGRLDLVAAPIFGAGATPPGFMGEASRIVLFDMGEEPQTGAWSPRVVTAQLFVTHAIEIAEPRGEDPRALLVTHAGGVAAFHGALDGRGFQKRDICAGATGEPPASGSSEVHLGHLGDEPFIATIDPWHGNQVVAYRRGVGEGATVFHQRLVLDDTLDTGHALWVADVDGDGDDEIFAGHRGQDARVSVYTYRRDSDDWERTVIDTQIAAQDLRGGDLNGDGVPDIVAIGGATHNLVWYRPLRPDEP